MGAVLGWMSTRVLGQYDLLVLEDEDPDDQDIVYYVGPNIASLERRFEFPEREFRLWVALHEVTHRTQFTGVPWLRPHFLGLVTSLVDDADVALAKPAPSVDDRLSRLMRSASSWQLPGVQQPEENEAAAADEDTWA